MTAISNPATSLPLYSLCYFIGHLVIGGKEALPDFATVYSIQGFLALGPHFFIAMLVGTTLVGTAGAIGVYFSSKRLLAALRRWHTSRSSPGNAPEPSRVASEPSSTEASK